MDEAEATNINRQILIFKSVIKVSEIGKTVMSHEPAWTFGEGARRNLVCAFANVGLIAVCASAGGKKVCGSGATSCFQHRVE